MNLFELVSLPSGTISVLYPLSSGRSLYRVTHGNATGTSDTPGCERIRKQITSFMRSMAKKWDLELCLVAAHLTNSTIYNELLIVC